MYLGNSSNQKPSIEKGFGFRIQCPGDYSLYPFKLILFNNGTVSKNIKYKNDEKNAINYNLNNTINHLTYNLEPQYNGLCREEMTVRIAKANIPSDFVVHADYNETGLNEADYSMKEHKYFLQWIGLYSTISHDWEIMKPFFLNHNIVPTYISSFQLGFWGQYDNNTKEWDGSVGLVSCTFKLNFQNVHDPFRFREMRLTWLWDNGNAQLALLVLVMLPSVPLQYHMSPSTGGLDIPQGEVKC